MATHSIIYYCSDAQHLGQTVLDDRFPLKFHCQACEKTLTLDLSSLEFKKTGEGAKTHILRQIKEVGVEK